MKEVEVNGTVLEFPDEMPDEAIRDVLRKKFPPQAQQKPDAGALASFAGGVNSVLGFPADTVAGALDLGIAGYGTLKRAIGGQGTEMPDRLDRSRLPLTTDWLARNAPSVFYPPGSEERPVVRAIGGGVGGAIAAPGTAGQALARAGVGALSGASGAVVGELGGGPEAQILASLAPAAGAGLVQNAWRERAKVLPMLDTAGQQAQQALRPHTDKQIKDAIELQRAGAAARMPLTAAQALSQVTGAPAERMVGLENRVLQSPYAPKSMLQEAQAQPARAMSTARQGVDQFVGKSDRSLTRANQIEQAAERVMEMPREVAGRTVQPIYDMLRRERPQLPEDVRWKIAGQLEGLNERVGLIEQSAAGQAVSDVARRATVESPIVTAKGQPFRRAEGGIYELDNYLKELRTRIDKVSSINPDAKQLVERAGLSPAHSSIRQALVDASPELATAKQQYQDIKKTLDAAVRGTGIPDMSRRFNADPTADKTAANWSTLEKLLTKEQSPADLKRAATFISAQDPKALTDITKNLLQSKLDSAQTPQAFVKSVRSVPNMLTAVELSARAQGYRNPQQVAAGFDKLLDVLEASGQPRGQMSTTLPKQIEQQSAGKSAASIFLGNQLSRTATVVRRAGQFLEKNEIDTLVKNMDTTHSLENLAALARSQPGSPKFKQVLSGLLSPTEDTGALALRSTLPLTSGLLMEQQ